MKKTIAILFIAAALGFSMFAQPAAPKGEQPQASDTRPLPPNAASKEQLQKLFEVIGVQKQMQSVLTSMASNMAEMMPHGGELSEKQKADMSKLQAALFGKMMSPEFMQSYFEMLVPVYQQHFTKTDVDQIIAFYSSPAGQKFVNEQPLIIQEIFPKVMPMMQQHMQEVMRETHYEDRLKEILAEGDKGQGNPK